MSARDTAPHGGITERWRDLLTHAVDKHPRGRAGVAMEIGLSRSAISQVLAGSYPARTERIARAVLDHYDRFICPHLGQTITQVQCTAWASRPCPTTSPAEVRHWRACQQCPKNPKE